MFAVVSDWNVWYTRIYICKFINMELEILKKKEEEEEEEEEEVEVEEQ